MADAILPGRIGLPYFDELPSFDWIDGSTLLADAEELAILQVS
jgi:hypothetical protein